MKHCILFVFLCCGVAECFAQQDPLYSQYLNNPLVLNPAYAGLTNNLNLSVSYRNQWSGYEGSPKTFNTNIHSSLFANKMGLGLMAVSDRIGNVKANQVTAVYSYRIKVTSDKTLSFGLQGGIVNYKIDNSKVRPYDTTDPLFQGSISEVTPTVGFGMIFTSDKFFISASIPRLLSSKVDILGEKASLYTPHFYVMGSYLFFLSERIRFRPSALVKIVDGASASLDLNASLIIYENYQAGLLTRNFNTHGVLLQALFKDKLRLGYVFELPTRSSVGTNFMTHEITLGLRMNVLPFHNNSGVQSF